MICILRPAYSIRIFTIFKNSLRSRSQQSRAPHNRDRARHAAVHHTSDSIPSVINQSPLTSRRRGRRFGRRSPPRPTTMPVINAPVPAIISPLVAPDLARLRALPAGVTPIRSGVTSSSPARHARLRHACVTPVLPLWYAYVTPSVGSLWFD